MRDWTEEATKEPLYSVLMVMKAVDLVTEGDELMMSRIVTALEMLREDPNIFKDVDSLADSFDELLEIRSIDKNKLN